VNVDYKYIKEYKVNIIPELGKKPSHIEIAQKHAQS